jgi:hypothetical protein
MIVTTVRYDLFEVLADLFEVLAMTTDRAKRYAANRNVADDKGSGCLFCGSKKFLTVDHLSGDEDDGAPANLAYLCKSCNTRKGAAFRKAGIGRPTNQYNPDLGLSPEERRNFSQLGFDFPPRREYDEARAAQKKRAASDRAEAKRRRREEKQVEQRRLKAELAEENRRLASEARAVAVMRKKAIREGDKERARELLREEDYLLSMVNPAATSIRTSDQWQEAVNAVLGGPSYMSVRAAASRIRATPPGQRRKLARPNPAKIPTYAQYAFAVAGYDHGRGDSSLSELIHRTPNAKRAEYARRIAAAKREHGTERRTGRYADTVPF